jgi:hypothetical protein
MFAGAGALNTVEARFHKNAAVKINGNKTRFDGSSEMAKIELVMNSQIKINITHLYLK